MASRALSPALRRLASPNFTLKTTRSFQTSSQRLADVTPIPPKRPIGAFRGGLFGFLLGSTLTGAGVYYYILDEYKVSNEILTEDIYSLQAAVQRVHEYVQTLEDKLDVLERKGR